MYGFEASPDQPATENPLSAPGKRKRPQVLSSRLLWRFSAGLVVIAILIILIVIFAPILGLTGNIAVGQGVTDHGLFMQVNSITFYKDETGQEDIMVSIKLRNDGNEDVNVVFGDEADGTNVLIVGTKFPGTNDPGFPLLNANRLPPSYDGKLLDDPTLQPGTTVEGLVFYATVQNGQRAVSIDFWHSLSDSPFNFYHWAIPQQP